MFQLPKLKFRRVAREAEEQKTAVHAGRPAYKRFPEYESTPQPRFVLALDRALWCGSESYSDNGSGRSYTFSAGECVEAYAKRSAWENKLVFRTVRHPKSAPAKMFGVVILDREGVMTNLQPGSVYSGADGVMSTFLESDEEAKNLNLSRRVVPNEEITKSD